jgi:hypothetical protein
MILRASNDAVVEKDLSEQPIFGPRLKTETPQIRRSDNHDTLSNSKQTVNCVKSQPLALHSIGRL